MGCRTPFGGRAPFFLVSGIGWSERVRTGPLESAFVKKDVVFGSFANGF
jgi:hypothetical protein